MTQDLETIQPTTESVVVGDKEITVRPVKVGQLPAFLRAVQPIIASLAASSASSPPGGQGSGDQLADGALDLQLSELDLLSLFTEHADNLLEAVAIVSGQPREFLDELELDQAAQLAMAAWRVNQDFFARRVLPHLGSQLTRANK